jgi:mRNA-degrading endonuclease RelE of RelBE toxin-antitoxin system
MFQIAFTVEAMDDLDALKKHDARRITDAIEIQLSSQPAVSTKSRKRLRPNSLADWELKVGTFRVFYNVDERESLVRVLAIGQKTGNRFFIHGERFDL